VRRTYIAWLNQAIGHYFDHQALDSEIRV
jgi:hypothetical protein